MTWRTLGHSLEPRLAIPERSDRVLGASGGRSENFEDYFHASGAALGPSWSLVLHLDRPGAGPGSFQGPWGAEFNKGSGTIWKDLEQEGGGLRGGGLRKSGRSKVAWVA